MSRTALTVRLVSLLVLLTIVASLLGNEPWGPK
jgi:hypothetical protein